MAPDPSRLLRRIKTTYRADDGGDLVPIALPAETVDARGERGLFRRLSRLANASDEAIVEAASDYGPLGPVARINVADQPAYLWALDGSVRGSLRQMRLLRAWIAHGGTSPVPGHVAPVAHALAVVAEADDGSIQRLVDVLEGSARLTPEERNALDPRMDRMEHRFLAGISRRAAQINSDFAQGERHVRVDVKAAARPRVASAARNWGYLLERASQDATFAEVVPPGSLGRMATELRPYFGQSDLPLIDPENVKSWRAACAELAEWAERLAAPTLDADRSALVALLVLRLQQVDAWPFPTGEVLGTFPRALWSIWPLLAGRPPDRRCGWPACERLLPPWAHGNRRHCDPHIKEADRRRSARNREAKRSARTTFVGRDAVPLTLTQRGSNDLREPDDPDHVA